MKASTYPTLTVLARKYMCVPASSVYSERLFSEYGNLYEKKRSRITPHIAEKVIFLHHNWRRVENNGRKPLDAVPVPPVNVPVPVNVISDNDSYSDDEEADLFPDEFSDEADDM